MAESDSNCDKDCLKDLPQSLQTAGEFLLNSAHRLKWGDLSKDTVMDIGCGMTSYQLFKTVFPKFFKVIALDFSSDNIDYLKFNEAHEKMDYHVADITNRSTLTIWEGQITKIFSSFCFHCLKDQVAGFKNINYLLKPGGEAIILTGLRNPHYECAQYLLAQEQWKFYQHLEKEFMEYKAHGTGISFYEQILKEMNFEVILFEEIKKLSTFSTEEEFRASHLTHDKTIEAHLPPIERPQFREDYAQALMKLNGITSKGELCLKTTALKIGFRKR